MDRAASLVLYLILASLVIGGDLWSKNIVFRELEVELRDALDGLPTIARARAPIEIIDGKLALEASVNRGAFNGMFAGARWLLLGVSAAWVLGTLVFVLWQRSCDLLLLIALSLTAGGAAGNLYDRFYLGVVRDFVKVYHGEWVWPNFNVADSSICVGVGLIILRELIVTRRQKREAAANAPPPREQEAAETP